MPAFIFENAINRILPFGNSSDTAVAMVAFSTIEMLFLHGNIYFIDNFLSILIS